MPHEIKTEEEFIAISERASEVRVKRFRDVVKLKLRTPHRLYTLKTDPSTAERLLSGLKIPVVEV